MNLTQGLVREYMTYEDGKLFWRISPSNRAPVGAEVGYLHLDGYRRVGFRGVKYRVHRLIFLYHHGYFPENGIDHVNRMRDDNQIENLREASHSCNMRNAGTRINNTSGIKGVYYNKAHGKWRGQILINGQNKHLGSYDTKLEAACARLAGEQCLNWQACDSDSPAYKYVKENL